MLCPECGTEGPAGARFCLHCGTKLALACPQCNTELPPESRFCFACGAELSAPPITHPTPPTDSAVDRLQRLVPREYAERLLATRGQITAERRTVTMLFSDVKGSTAMAEKLDPEDVLDIMSGAFELLIEPIVRHEGTVARLMGDAVLAFFGAPLSHEDDPERAVRAALEITAGAQQYAERLESERGIQGFDVRVGIHTGLVVVGEVGTDLHVEYTAMGDAVNLAARLEQHAPLGGVLISHDTYRHVRGVFDVLPQPPLAVKGKTELVQTYLVARAKPRPFRKHMRGVEGVETRMVGREAELTHLQDAFHTAREDIELQVVTVTGDVGVGKSRLLHEFDIWAEALPDLFYYFKGRALAEMQDTPYGLIRSLITFRFQIQDSDAPAVVQEKLEAGTSAALGDGVNSRAAAHYLGHLAGLEFGDSEFLARTPDDAQALRDRALAYLADYFKGMAARRSVLILLEDLHWADDSSLEALNHLALALTDQPVMIAGTARPMLFERRPHWGEGQSFHSRLALRPLSKWDSRRLVVEILQKLPEVPQALRDLIVAGAEGNPFYIEELVKMQIEDGVIVKEEERWRLDPARLAKVRVPESLTGILQARLDRLPPEERTVLQQASVVGRLFWDRAVARIRESTGEALEPGKLAENLSNLRDRELVYQRETSAFVDAQEYIFKHTLLREVTYDSVLKRLRRTYHGVVADWLLEQGGDRVGELAALIADHLALAGRATEAIDHLLQAGDRARNLYAHQEAIRAYERGLALLRELGDNKGVAQTLMKLGLVYTAAFQPDKAQEVYREAFTLWESMPEASGPSELPVSTALLRFAVTEPSTLDPGAAGDDVSTFMTAQLFEGLVSVDADHNVLPAVAARWEVHDAGQRYLFRLREGLRWSDGLPLTAADFEYAWKRNLAPALRSPLAHLLYVLENARAFGEGAMDDPNRVGVAALDDLTLEVRLEGPTAYLPHLLALPIAYPLPRRVLDGAGQYRMDPGNLISNGAYQLEEWQRGKRLVLCRNPYYHGRFPGNAERVECPVLTDFEPALEAYAADDLDGISMITSDPGTTARAQAAYGSELIFTPQPSTPYLFFRADWPPFDDVRVRRAFVRAVDREALAKEAWQGQYLPATGGFIPPGMPGHSADISPAYNPEQARRLLVQAGYPNGQEFPEITWLCPGGSADNPVIPFLKRAWHNHLGVNLEAQSLEWGAYMERRKRDPAHLALSAWLADYPDPDSLLRVVFHSTEGINPGRWHNPRFDALVEEAARLTDQTRRMALYQEADRILVAEEAAIMPLGYAQGRTLVKPWVTIPRVPPALMRFKHVVLQRSQR